MGTPDFAVASLDALVRTGENVIAVVTQADKPSGRGYKLTPPAVKVYAEAHGIPVYQPATLKGEEFASLLSELDPELCVVASFGKILPANVLDYPKYGCINVHGSLLPEYRGAAPIQRAIIDGKKFTGITTMMMDVGLDTGDMLLWRRVDILDDDNFETVHDKMAATGGDLLIDTLKELKNGTLKRIPQSTSNVEPTYAAKISKEECPLDFNTEACTLHDKIRGLSPIPLSFTHTPDGKMLKVIKAEKAENAGKAVPGTVVSVDGGKITVACGEDGCGRIRILSVLPEGKSRMNASDFINGRRIKAGDILS